MDITRNFNGTLHTKKQLFKKANSILTDCSHPLHQQFQFLP